MGNRIVRSGRGIAIASGLALAMVLFSTVAVEAQSSQRPSGPAPARDQQADAVNRYFFQPRLVLGSAEDIGLTPEQRAAVEAAMHESQESFRRARFELSNAMTVIAGLAVQHPIDEAEILAQLDHVLDTERQIKRGQMLMLVRIKNALTPEQHLQLREIKARHQRPQGQQP